MLDVLTGFFWRQWLKVIAARNALRQLSKIVAGEQFAQLGLANQDDLQQLLSCGFEIGQQTHFFEHLRCKILCLVDNKNGAPAVCMCVKQIPVKRIDQRLDAVLPFWHLDAEFLANGLEKLKRGELWVEYDRDVGVARHPIK